MNKELRIRNFEERSERNKIKTQNYNDLKEEEEIYVLPIAEKSPTQLLEFLETKFDKLTEKKPYLFNKITRVIVESMKKFYS